MKYKEIAFLLIILTSGMTHLYPSKVISLSPSITEIIFELGKGDLIIGNTRFCNFPPDSKSIKKIGGFIDINVEMIIKLKPDIIFHYPEHSPRTEKLRQFTKLVEVSHKNINDLLGSIEIISKELDAYTKGQKLIRNIRSQLDRISRNNRNIKKKKVVIIIGRDPSRLRNLTIIGKGDFLNEIIRISGGINAYGGDISYPTVSIESLIKMDPELIIEFSFSEKPVSRKQIMSLWNKFPYLKAVEKNMIHIISEDFWVRPGPRIVKIAESMHRLLHLK